MTEAKTLPFSHDRRAQAAVLADLPDSVAQEAGEFYEAYGAANNYDLTKRECMAEAWRGVLRPYLIGLRDHYQPQARPDAFEAQERQARESVAAFMLRNSFATGHGDTLDDLLGELDAQVRERASAQERLSALWVQETRENEAASAFEAQERLIETLTAALAFYAIGEGDGDWQFGEWVTKTRQDNGTVARTALAQARNLVPSPNPDKTSAEIAEVVELAKSLGFDPKTAKGASQ